ncbi:MAG: anti-sigma factor [Isosphaeraceae bacterium]
MTADSREPLSSERLSELLAGEVLGDLSDEERAELDRLRESVPEEAGRQEAWTLELAAGALELGLDPPRVAPLPVHLKDRIHAGAVGHFGGPRLREALPSEVRPHRRRAAGRRLSAWGGWFAAAAAGLAAFWLWWYPRGFEREPAPRPPIPPTPAPVARTSETPEEDLERLLASVKPLPLKATDHPLAVGASGSLVWDPGRRKGYLKLTGLAEVRPAQGVYQLWIFDRRRDSRYPVLGSTFTIDDAKRPSVVPIRPELEVSEPVQYAITLEPPGGVVVSDRRRVLLVASAGPGG